MNVFMAVLLGCLWVNALPASTGVLEDMKIANAAALYTRLACEEIELRMSNVDNCTEHFCKRTPNFEQIKTPDGFNIMYYHKKTCLANLIAVSARNGAKQYAEKIKILLESLHYHPSLAELALVQNYREQATEAARAAANALTKVQESEGKVEWLRIRLDRYIAKHKAKKMAEQNSLTPADPVVDGEA